MSATNANSTSAASINPPRTSARTRKPPPNIHVAAERSVPDSPAEAKKTPLTQVEEWLDWQCRMVSGVHYGAVFLVRNAGHGGFLPTASWPGEINDPSTLRMVAEKAVSNAALASQNEAIGAGPDSEVADFVAYPLFDGHEVVGAVALSLAIRSEVQRQAVLQLLQWGKAWLESIVNGESADRSAASVFALEMVSLVSRDLPLAVVGHDLCNSLAERFECSRVALGIWSGLQIRVLSMSHQVQFDRRVSHVEHLEFAMEECVDQGSIVTLPAESESDQALTKAHVQLLQEDGNGSVCSVPLKDGDDPLAAIILLRNDKNPLDEKTLATIALVAERITPLVRVKQRDAQSIWRKALQASAGGVRRVLGAGHLRLKAALAASVVLLAMLTLIQTDHRVAADSTIEGALQQAVVAPFAGYLASANTRAGDQVEEGQVLAVLDDRELLLEQEKWSSERDKHSKEYQQALAVRDRAKVSMMAARVAQAEAQLRLVEEQLQRTELRAPFAGVLVSGDLSRSLGAPVERGQLLFEIVPSEGYHVSLQVDEHDVAMLQMGQEASLRLTGLPNQAIPLRISRILPVASAQDGGNHFRVEAEMQDAPAGLRPGMEGVAKVVVGRGSLLQVWTASLRDRLRLWAWSLGL